MLPEPSHEVTISALRFCTLVSLTYYLFLDHHIPKRMWHLMLRIGRAPDAKSFVRA